MDTEHQERVCHTANAQPATAEELENQSSGCGTKVLALQVFWVVFFSLKKC